MMRRTLIKYISKLTCRGSSTDWGLFVGQTKNERFCFASIKRLQEGYAAKEFSVEEVVEEHLCRADYLKKYNFFINYYPELARTAALEARRDETGASFPLHGIPYHYKDLALRKTSIAYTDGSRLVAKYQVPVGTHDLVSLMEKSGAIFMGTTNTPEFVHKGDTTNLLVGSTKNPHNPDKTAGGSSGGAAAAISCGVGTVALASDGLGSIRIPASFTGTVGYKPDISEKTLKVGDMGALGVITRTVQDSAVTMDSILKGMTKINYYQQALASSSKPTFKIGFSLDLGFADVDDEVTSVINAAVEKIIKSGVEVDFIREISSAHMAPSVSRTIWLDRFLSIYNHLYKSKPDKDELLDPSFLEYIIAPAREVLAPNVEKALSDRQEVQKGITSFFENYDFLITPTVATVPWTVGLSKPEGNRYDHFSWNPFCPLANISGNAAISIPVGNTDCGLPIGLQIIAKRAPSASSDDIHLHSSKLFHLASFIESIFGWEIENRPEFPELKYGPGITKCCDKCDHLNNKNV